MMAIESQSISGREIYVMDSSLIRSIRREWAEQIRAFSELGTQVATLKIHHN